MNEKILKWKSDLDEIIKDVQHISKNRKVYWELQEIVEANDKINKANVIHDIMASGFLLSCLMGLRRHVKVKKESLSFMKLLSEIQSEPQVINRDFYRGLADEDWGKELLDRTFDKFVQSGKDYINPEMIENDKKNLKAAFLSSEAFVDKKIAHLDTTPPSRIPNFKELVDSWDLFENLIRKYYLILTGSTLSSVAPIMQYDWKEILRVPWIEAVETKEMGKK